MMKTLFEERLKNLGRKYYEVFGDLESMAEFLKLISLILAGLLFLAFIGIIAVAKKQPIVIRVSDVGEAEAIRDIVSNNAATEPEILFFAKAFTKRFSEYNSYTLGRDIAEAMNMMTARYQKIAKRSLIESGMLSKLKEAGLNTTIEFKEAKLERNTKDFAQVSLIGVRNLASFVNPNFKEASLFKVDLMLKKCSRSLDIPQGLLVEDYREIILNQLENSNDTR